MSQENVEIVRLSNEAFVRKEFERAVEAWDDRGEWIPAMAGAIEGTVYRGRAGLLRYFNELFDSFSDVRLEDLDYSDLGDRVLVCYRLRVRGHDSGVAIDQPAAAVYELSDGKIVHGRSYLSEVEALEAVGLSG